MDPYMQAKYRAQKQKQKQMEKDKFKKAAERRRGGLRQDRTPSAAFQQIEK